MGSDGTQFKISFNCPAIIFSYFSDRLYRIRTPSNNRGAIIFWFEIESNPVLKWQMTARFPLSTVEIYLDNGIMRAYHTNCKNAAITFHPIHVSMVLLVRSWAGGWYNQIVSRKISSNASPILVAMCDVQSAPPDFPGKLSGGSQFSSCTTKYSKRPRFSWKPYAEIFLCFTKVYVRASNGKLIFHAIAGESIREYNWYAT